MGGGPTLAMNTEAGTLDILLPGEASSLWSFHNLNTQ